MFRGRDEAILRLALVLKEDAELAAAAPTAGERMIATHFRIRARGRAADAWLADTVRAAWRSKLAAHLETDLLGRLRERAETEAIAVFANNLRDLLLAAPAGRRVTMGLDPGLRTRREIAVVDATGKLVATATIYPHARGTTGTPPSPRSLASPRAHAVELVASATAPPRAKPTASPPTWPKPRICT
jgi:uncharacterized protein